MYLGNICSKFYFLQRTFLFTFIEHNNCGNCGRTVPDHFIRFLWRGFCFEGNLGSCQLNHWSLNGSGNLQPSAFLLIIKAEDFHFLLFNSTSTSRQKYCQVLAQTQTIPVQNPKGQTQKYPNSA